LTAGQSRKESNVGKSFDAFARLLEKIQAPGDLRSPLRRGRLFEFPYIPHDVLPKTVEPDVLEFNKQNFFLPFRHTIIEDRCGVTVLWDAEKDQRGLFKPRMFMDYVALRADISNFREAGSPEAEQLRKEQAVFAKDLPDSTAVITYGWFQMAECGTDRMQFTGDVSFAVCASEEGVLSGPKDLLKAPNCRVSALTNVNTAMQEVAYLNTPDRFVLERTPKLYEKRRNKKHNGILRSHERPTYVLLEPHEIWKQMGVAEPQGLGTDKSPHPRRAHIRKGHTKVLTSWRYKDARGKVVTIPDTVVKECWVGPSEAVVGNTTYRVMLEGHKCQPD
jgi:hypothetical protein